MKLEHLAKEIDDINYKSKLNIDNLDNQISGLRVQINDLSKYVEYLLKNLSHISEKPLIRKYRCIECENNIHEDNYICKVIECEKGYIWK